MAVHASVATVADLTTDASVGNSLWVGLSEIRCVGRRSFAVALTAFRFVPSVASLAKCHVLSGFTDMDFDEVLWVRHISAVTVGAEFLLVACLATLQPFPECFLSMSAFNSSPVPRPSPQHEVRLLVRLGLGADVAVVAELFRVASGTCLLVRPANDGVLNRLSSPKSPIPSPHQFAVPLQEVRCFVAFGQSASVAFIA